MLLDRIEKMRKKSYAERQRVTLVVSVCTTALIAFVWGTVILPQTLTIGEAEASRADTATPLKTLSEDMSIILGDIQKGVSQLGSEIERTFGGEEESVPGIQEDSGLPLSPRGEESFPENLNVRTKPNESVTDTTQTNEPTDTSEEVIILDGFELPETQAGLDIEGQNPF